MIKYILALSGLVVLALAQRPPYAGTANRYPQVLPQYLPAVSSNDIVDTTTGINQRIGGNSGTVEPPKYEPYDPYNDQELIARIKTWPKEKQPFWYLNREAIAAQRGSGTPKTSTTTRQRPSFAGSV